MNGRNTPIVARIDTELRGLGLRVANLVDLSRPEVMEMVRGKYYSDIPALILRSIEDSHAPNRAIISQLVPVVEQRQGTLKLPVIINGFDAVSSEGGEGYKWTIVPRDDFSVIQDERLDGKYNGARFSDVDELGLPKFDKGGSRTFYARNQGISRLYLDRYLDLNSYNEYLAYSDEVGRVVVVSGEAAGENFARQYANKLKAEQDARKKALDEWFEESMTDMPGK